MSILMPAEGSMSFSPESSIQAPVPARALIDLTDDPIEPSSDAQADHMGLLSEQLCPRPRRKPGDIPNSPPSKGRNSHNDPASKKSKRRSSKPSTSPITTRSPSFKLPPNFTFPTAPTTPVATVQKRTPFPFLTLPPELRNRIYTILLTSNQPIEPWCARSTTAARSAAWASAQKKRKERRAFKRIFLEILCVSRQVHLEATGILYGSNIFKFRSDHTEGKIKQIPFAERYLGLLRIVKVVVISREEHVGQDVWVAGLLAKLTGARLERFELTWYGWNKYRLTEKGPLCEALLKLTVEKTFRVIVSAEARLRTAMLEELKTRCGARDVQIQRPMVMVMRDGVVVEISDDEGN